MDYGMKVKRKERRLRKKYYKKWMPSREEKWKKKKEKKWKKNSERELKERRKENVYKEKN